MEHPGLSLMSCGNPRTILENPIPCSIYIGYYKVSWTDSYVLWNTMKA